MRRDAWAKLFIGCMTVGIGGGIAGMGLANYTASGAFHFYKQTASESRWRSPRDTYSTMPQTSDLGFASTYRSLDSEPEPTPQFASFD